MIIIKFKIKKTQLKYKYIKKNTCWYNTKSLALMNDTKSKSTTSWENSSVCKVFCESTNERAHERKTNIWKQTIHKSHENGDTGEIVNIKFKT